MPKLSGVHAQMSSRVAKLDDFRGPQATSRRHLCFDQFHVDVARNSTDDFNPFHDPQRWQQVVGNPFQSTIALGFQIEFLVSDRVTAYRRANAEDDLVERNALHYSNYEFRFADALHAAESFKLDIRETLDKTGSGGGISNRIVVRRSDGEKLILIGTQSETTKPRFLPGYTLNGIQALQHLPSGSLTSGGRYFCKRKFLNTSNGKNFALGSLCDQRDYFDELADRVYFAPLFTASLLSSALLEKGRVEGYDFVADPLVYTSHQISVDNRLQKQLRSNDKLHILIEGPLAAQPSKGLGQTSAEQMLYRCFGVLGGHQILFRANVQLAPLHGFLSAE